MLRGLSTVSFFADDVAAARDWYTEFLGFEPYFTRPGYVEFRIGDYQHELGIIDRKYAPDTRDDEPAGAIVYWHVDDVRAAFDRLVSLGATPYEEPVERGPGFVTASVTDPFGNILGVMYNQHYLDVLRS
jgi:catechol 2,3-dioxygenase-like lactoylglutathione lyase family enzyme